MGKQINYYLEFESFKLIAQKALDLGCEIVREDLSKFAKTKVTVSCDLSILTDEDGAYYFFHLPEAGKLKINNYECGERLDHGFNESGNSIIEAGYSRVSDAEKRVSSSRLYLTTGYFDKNENFIYRPDCIVKVYNSLARYVKKLAPYTELTDTYTSIREENYGQPVEYQHKEYVTPFCLDLREKGYKLR